MWQAHNFYMIFKLMLLNPDLKNPGSTYSSIWGLGFGVRGTVGWGFDSIAQPDDKNKKQSASRHHPHFSFFISSSHFQFFVTRQTDSDCHRRNNVILTFSTEQYVLPAIATLFRKHLNRKSTISSTIKN